MAANKNNAQRTFLGYVIINEKDRRGNIVQIALETEDFQKFIVGDNIAARKLLNLINSKICVEGYIAEKSYDGQEIIFVKNFSLCL